MNNGGANLPAMAPLNAQMEQNASLSSTSSSSSVHSDDPISISSSSSAVESVESRYISVIKRRPSWWTHSQLGNRQSCHTCNKKFKSFSQLAMHVAMVSQAISSSKLNIF